MEFEDLEKILIDARAGSRAAECHGFLCGYFCVSENLQDEIFKKFLLADSVDCTQFEVCCEKISELADEVNVAISSDVYELQLLLPGDNYPMSERGAALIQWCVGFLSGLGVAGMTGLEHLSSESREVIEDISKICRLDADDMDGAGEDEESAFFELTEYVRMGAMLLHEEFHKMTGSSDRPEVLH